MTGLKAYPFSGDRSTSSMSPGVEGASMLATVLRGRFRYSESPLMFRRGLESGGVAGQCWIWGAVRVVSGTGYWDAIPLGASPLGSVSLDTDPFGVWR